MSAYYVSCLNKDQEMQHFEVPYEIYVYVQQLEQYIKHPKISELKERYPNKFGETKGTNDF